MINTSEPSVITWLRPQEEAGLGVAMLQKVLIKPFKHVKNDRSKVLIHAEFLQALTMIAKINTE